MRILSRATWLLAAGLAAGIPGAAVAAESPFAFRAPSPLALGGEVTLPGMQAAPAALDPAPLVLANPYVVPPALAVSISGTKQEKAPKAARARRPRKMPNLALTPERAQAMLRSMAVPGWGQATLGHPTAGAVFGVIESGVWGSFMAFRIQERLRREGSARTARIFAGVDLKGRDEEFLRLVGAFASSAEYNLLVVTRDAANLYYDEPDRYRDYIATHSLGGTNHWSWQDEASFLRYRAQRKDAQRAGLRANTALALAVGNRILSVLHTARIAGRKAAPAATTPRTWNFEVRPAGGDDPTAYRFGLRASF